MKSLRQFIRGDEKKKTLEQRVKNLEELVDMLAARFLGHIHRRGVGGHVVLNKPKVGGQKEKKK